MSRDLEQEEAVIRNGNRFVREVGGNGVFPRDVDRLVQQYRNLRLKVYNTHKDYFPDEATRQELMSYIDEQFVRLTKEYVINGEVDFPGYIKKALNLRVKHSFVKGRNRDGKRERLGSKDNEVDGLLADDKMSADAIADAELIDDLLTSASFSPIEVDVFICLVKGTTKDRDIARELADKHSVSLKDAKESIRVVKEYLLLKLRN